MTFLLFIIKIENFCVVSLFVGFGLCFFFRYISLSVARLEFCGFVREN